ncbi:hypothetical protein AGRA3207_003137 [Actinomadura graeca]|uniref:Uncharacterized protein n=1 Tax=Actinomadura graeca TaxID=2750812 RepID=A0ABX8QTM5_9ACTN|nr:hypothetical protein [Actinomadura graeca]QXJ22176.1 hypothetical protein AGRA3207_003137 [Actinomadura graeca]
MAGMLYYPDVNPPEEILYQAILYWDSLATITTPDHRALLSPALREIEDAGHYTPVDLNSADFGRPLWRSLVDDLMPLVGRSGPGAALPAAPPYGSPEWTMDTDITWESWNRYPREVVEELLDLGVVTPVEGTRTLLIGPRMRRLLISLAAETMAAEMTRVLGRRYFAHTADYDAFHAGHVPEREGDEVRLAWQVDLGAVLPIPAPGTPIGAVLAFRAGHEEERRRLVRAVQALQRDLRSQGNGPREVIEHSRDELVGAMADLERAGTASRIDWIRRSAYVFIAMAASGAAIEATALAVPLLVGSGLAINLATNKLSRPSITENGFSYLHLARHHFPTRNRPLRRPS